MPVDLIATYLRLPVFLLVVSRLGGLVMFQPLLGGYAIPPTIRALLVVGLAAVVTPLVHVEAGVPVHALGFVLAMGNELLLGVLMGLVVRMCFVGLQLGGQMIAQDAGLAFGRIADPATGMSQSTLSNFYLQLGAVVFLIVGGHRVLVAVALDTFRTIPLLGDGGVFGGGLAMFLDAFSLAGEIAIRVAAPTMLTLLLIKTAMGFVSRTVPQFNILTIGFSLKGLVAFLLMAISLPAALEAFTGGLALTVDWIGGLVRG